MSVHIKKTILKPNLFGRPLLIKKNKVMEHTSMRHLRTSKKIGTQTYRDWGGGCFWRHHPIAVRPNFLPGAASITLTIRAKNETHNWLLLVPVASILLTFARWACSTSSLWWLMAEEVKVNTLVSYSGTVVIRQYMNCFLFLRTLSNTVITQTIKGRIQLLLSPSKSPELLAFPTMPLWGCLLGPTVWDIRDAF